MCCREELHGNFAFEVPFLSRGNLADERMTMRYSLGMPATKKRPVILFPRRRSPNRKAIAKAIKEMADLRKNDPKAYEALIKKSAGRTVTIVPG
jgi:hypothetical protein